jgi:hypothetical protein
MASFMWRPRGVQSDKILQRRTPANSHGLDTSTMTTSIGDASATLRKKSLKDIVRYVHLLRCEGLTYHPQTFYSSMVCCYDG